MNRLTFFLLFALMFCALSLVSAQHEARTLFVALDRAQAEEKQLDVDWSRLQYQQSSLGKSARISDVARAQLKMGPAAAGRTQYLPGFATALPADSSPGSVQAQPSTESARQSTQPGQSADGGEKKR